jgi:pyruvate/2-oxoglutarate/acetoin dehydrogenase E1 component
VLIVHEDNEFGGYGAELAAQLVDKGFEWLDAPVRRYCAPEVPNFPFAQAMEDMTYPSTEGIVTRARALAQW